MLQAAAVRVFYLRTDNTGIKAGFDKFLKLIPENAVIISESNSLGRRLRVSGTTINLFY